MASIWAGREARETLTTMPPLPQNGPSGQSQLPPIQQALDQIQQTPYQQHSYQQPSYQRPPPQGPSLLDLANQQVAFHQGFAQQPPYRNAPHGLPSFPTNVIQQSSYHNHFNQQALYQQTFSHQQANQQALAPATPKTPYQDDIAVLSHLVHALNAGICCINVYLSFEPLARNVSVSELMPRPGFVPYVINVYQPGMDAQASILQDLVVNIGTVFHRLMRSKLHVKLEKDGAYNSLVTGTLAIRAVVTDLPRAPHGMAVPLPTSDAVARMYKGCDNLLSLCKSDPAKEIAGWKEIWKSVDEVLKQAVG